MSNVVAGLGAGLVIMVLGAACLAYFAATLPRTRSEAANPGRPGQEL